jgi:SAM-dependent methyltransferase
MRTAQIVQRVYWRALRSVGLERLSWDRQFEAGFWHRGAYSPNTIRQVAGLCAGGRLIEFGCGAGDLPYLLPPGSFTEYLGYDISTVAIRQARRRAAESGRTDVHYEQCDMAKWQGETPASLILLEECLYYLPPARIEKFLGRCCDSLAPGGSILVIVHSASKHAQTLEMCRRVCNVMDETTIGARAFLTLGPKK